LPRYKFEERSSKRVGVRKEEEFEKSRSSERGGVPREQEFERVDIRRE